MLDVLNGYMCLGMLICALACSGVYLGGFELSSQLLCRGAVPSAALLPALSAHCTQPLHHHIDLLFGPIHLRGGILGPPFHITQLGLGLFERTRREEI